MIFFADVGGKIMEHFRYFMPADCYFGRGCVNEHKNAMEKQAEVLPKKMVHSRILQMH